MPSDIRDSNNSPASGAQAEPHRTGRIGRCHEMSKRLSEFDDSHIMMLLEGTSAPILGIGGAATTVTVDDLPVFVKQVPLTDLERLPENTGSTANIFHLPPFYQYGIGSTGFGVWREVAAHTMTTQWVLDRRCHGFPLLYHWRVLPQPSPPSDAGELERWVEHWEGDSAVRARLQAISTASATVALFMEYIPHTVDAWLTAQTAAGGETADAAYTFVNLALQEGVEFMQAQGLTHFDAHFRNLLTDGRRLYFADFGLAVHSGFDLDAAESSFLRRHRGYDRGYTATHLTQWLVSNLLGLSWPESHDHIRAHALDSPDLGLAGSAARIAARHAPVAKVMVDFYTALGNVSKRTPFPAEALSGAFQI